MEPASDRGKAPASKERFSRVVIRKYEPKDRAAVRRICYDTGLMGDPIDPYFGCAELFADYWMNYYTDYEPESAFVAELDGKVIGYLMGCKDTLAQQEIRNIEIMPKIRRKFLTFGYRAEWRLFGYLWRYLRSMLGGEFADEPIGDYPAHLHINLAEGYRSGGIGTKLLFAYLDYLRENGVRGLHLGTTTYNKLATPFYEKRGFRLTARRPITMYEGIVPEKIEALFFVREVT